MILLASITEDIVKTGETFGFQPQIFLSQVVSFLIVAFLLYKFAYGPVQKVLDERRKTIADGLASAEKMRAELAAAETKVQQVLRDAGAKADGVVAEARQAAESVAQRKTQEAAGEAQKIIEAARAATKLEADQIKTELKQEFGRLIVATTAKVTGKVLSADDQQRLNDEAAREVAGV